MQLRFGQSYAGIPAFDSGLRVTLDRAGRVLGVTGAPQPDLRVASTEPRVDSAGALRELMDHVGGRRPIRVTDGPSGPRQVTRFGGENRASLVLFAAEEVRLAWHLTYTADSDEVYDAVVDARTGDVLRRVNLVKHAAAADVYDFHPGGGSGGTPRRVDLEERGYLPPGAPFLAGRFAEAYSDVDGNDAAGAGEQVTRTGENDFAYPFTRFDGAAGQCSADAYCTWDHTEPASWRTNRAQATVQAFYAVNRFAGHLRSAAIGFDDASGAFGGDDPVLVETQDGAAVGTEPYRNNANMYTPPDGSRPRMQLYLFGGPANATRDVDSADDSAVVFHEYAHGLSSRLVTYDNGVQALSSPHGGALGEAWSDFYAQDLLVREGHVADTETAGEVRPAAYFATRPDVGRTQGLDCPVGAPAGSCPGGRTGQGGGYTFGDFGKVGGFAEVHSDGEIWAETLWDLRTALVRRLGRQAGSDAVERLVTGGLRFAPPEPSFLDARNAIVAADAAVGGSHRDLLWSVFAARGMGFFAAAEDGADLAPVEDFSPLPDPGAPRGALGGRVIDELSGLPLAGVEVSFAGHATTLAARTGEDGGYRIDDVPAGRYPKLLVRGRAGYEGLAERDVAVAGGQTATRELRLRRNWAARGAGARKLSSTNDPYAQYGCGAGEAIDERRTTAWLSVNPTTRPAFPTAAMVVELPEAIDVRAFGMDPRTGCGTGIGASTRDFLLETSPSGEDGTWSTALRGSFAPEDVGRLNVREPAGAARDVRFVRLTLLEPFSETSDSGRDFIGFSELQVFGATPNDLPAGPLAATPARAAPGQTVRLDAGGVRDPDSAITGYDWDLDGDGSVERSTAGPVTEVAYPAPGRPAPRVLVRDFRGGAGSAQATVDV
ncbi:MAG: M36 family metallopeptidase, partial [Actinomycetota bacterium]|nr:M36 family metallopeptidase [Actinomycetota bacterium]